METKVLCPVCGDPERPPGRGTHQNAQCKLVGTSSRLLVQLVRRGTLRL